MHKYSVSIHRRANVSWLPISPVCCICLINTFDGGRSAATAQNWKCTHETKKKEIDDDLMAPKEPAMCATIGNMKVSSSHNPAQEEKKSFFLRLAQKSRNNNNNNSIATVPLSCENLHRRIAVKFKTYLKNKEMRQEQVLTVAKLRAAQKKWWRSLSARRSRLLRGRNIACVGALHYDYLFYCNVAQRVLALDILCLNSLYIEVNDTHFRVGHSS